MRYLYVVLAIYAVISLASCGGGVESERLRHENDSLRAVNSRIEEEVNAYFDAVAVISAGMEKVKSIGGYISSRIEEETDSLNRLKMIEEDMRLVENILDKNRQDIESLKKRLANSGLKIQNLEKTIDAMTSEVNSLSYSIDSLNTVIVRKDSMIAMQKSSIETLQEDMTALRSEKQAVDEALARRTDEFYTAWYVFGTSKELKDQGIIAKSGAFSQKKVLEGDFNRDYFVKVDRREISQIPLYAKKAKVLTSHPADSYILEKQGGQYTLRIIDADAFWSVSRYLVVMIN